MNLDFSPSNLYSNENSNILWAVQIVDDGLAIQVIALDNYDTSEHSRSLKIDNRKSDFVLLPDNKLAFLSTENKLTIASMLTGEVSQIPVTLTEDCTIIGRILTLSNILILELMHEYLVLRSQRN